ncbi:MAG: hypothetical protein BWK79_05825 [Beggiatoa sp. IS2]|nr:MAG: hypothetical protein BWK79_05825 [Beggiatoa sp. IS2]
MTLFVIDYEWMPISVKFFEIAEAKTNFSAVFLWKKADFVNGGASAKAITLDDTSKISVDIVRHVVNIEGGRFVVQDGDQFWISEYLIDVKDMPKQGMVAELYPLESRWAVYNPSGCDIEFDRETTFTNHIFEDIQAVGVYFANYEFIHAVTMFTFDNFQFYATNHSASPELSPSSDLKGIAIDSKGHFIDTDASFFGDVTTNGTTLRVHPFDQLDIRGVITVDSNHVGKEGEIIIVVGYKPFSLAEESFFMFDHQGNVLRWDENIANLVAIQEKETLIKEQKSVIQNIVLAPERRVQLIPTTLSVFREDETTFADILLGCAERPALYSGIIGLTGYLRIFYGYRLKEDNTIVFNSKSIDLIIEE